MFHIRHIITCLSFLFLASSLLAQPDYASLTPDDQFTLARKKAFDGERKTSRLICRLILDTIPTYNDARVLLARTWSWDHEYANARTELDSVLFFDPMFLDAYLARADVELWNEKPEEALNITDKGLNFYPNQTDLLVKRAKALYALALFDEALFTLNRAEAINPSCSECATLRRQLRTARFKYILGLYTGVDHYSVVYGNMQFASLQFTGNSNLGGYNIRLNQAWRFSQNGIQPELEAYPRLWKTAYGLVNYAFSSSPLFPNNRIGGEIFQTLPHSTEASLGIRYLNFSTSPDIALYTTYFGWYYKDYWFSARLFLTPSSKGFTNSVNFSTRKYFAHALNYLGMTIGAGFYPDQRRIQTNEGLATNNIYYLKSQRLEMNFQHLFNQRLIWGIDLSFTRQEMSYLTGNLLYISGISTNLRIRL